MSIFKTLYTNTPIHTYIHMKLNQSSQNDVNLTYYPMPKEFEYTKKSRNVSKVTI